MSSLESPSQLKEDSSHTGITNKYLEVALLADEQFAVAHGDKTEEFLLLIGSIVSEKPFKVMWKSVAKDGIIV